MLKAFKSFAFISLACLASHASASVLFSDNFNTPTSLPNGQDNAQQSITGFNVTYGATFANWTANSNSHAIHLVNLNNAGAGSTDWAAMLFDGGGGLNDNVITSTEITSGNTLGQSYSVSFDLAAAQYNTPSQATGSTDGIIVEVLNSLDVVIQTQTFLPGAFDSSASSNSLPFKEETLNYTGTGSGNGGVFLEFTANNAGSGHFGGTIDNVQLASVPEPQSYLLMLAGLAAMATLVKRRKQI